MKVFQALGVADHLGFSQISHSDHCGFPAGSKSDLTAFINRFLLDQNANTTVRHTDGTFSMDEKPWVDWAAPTLV
jgi:hypothetical protein